MTLILDRLQSLRVSDVMNRDVVSVSAAQTMGAAAAAFAAHGISGARGVDEQGRCVGVISAADFVRCDGANDKSPAARAACGPTVARREPNGSWEIHEE